MTTLYVCDQGTYTRATDTQILSRAQQLVAKKFARRSKALLTPKQVRDFLCVYLHSYEYEVFGLVHLDTQNRVIAVEELFRGTVDQAHIYSREVIKTLLQHNASSVILFHNHPMGIAEPSLTDELLTRRLKTAFEVFDIQLLDHIIVADITYSFSEHGLL